MAVGMVVIAMLVVAMAVGVVVMMTVVMVMIVTMGMRMIVAVIVRGLFGRVRMAAGIGAAFGVERRFDLDHPRAEPLHHRLDDVIAPDPQALGHDLGRQMPVTQMPGDPHQMMRIMPANFKQRLRRCDHLDQPAVLKHQRIAAAQCQSVFQIEQELQATRAGHRHPPPVPVVEIEHDSIGRGVRPAMLALNFGGADHVNLPW